MADVERGAAPKAEEDEEEDTDPEMPQLIPVPVVLSASPPVPRERSVAELAAMSKFQRRAYYEARVEAAAKRRGRPALNKIGHRAAQEAQRKAKSVMQQGGASGEPGSWLAEVESWAETTEAAAASLCLDDSDSDSSEESEDSGDDAPAGASRRAVAAGSHEDGLHEAIRRCLARQAATAARVLSRRDLEAEVADGFGEGIAPPRLLTALLAALAREGASRVDLASPRPQLSIAADQFRPLVAACAAALEELCAAVGGRSAAGAVVDAARSAAAEVGFIMALRDAVDCLTDDVLYAACLCLEQPSRVMQGFIRFLRETEEGEDSSDTSDDEA